MTTATVAPRIYVACLAAYNNGTLHGAWIDATDADEIAEAVAAMLAASPVAGAEEWAIHDHEGFGGWSPGESEDFATVAEVGALLEEHGAAFGAWLSDGGAVDGAEFEEAFAGVWDSEEAFAENLADDLGLMHGWPDEAQRYFNWQMWTRDLFIGDYWRDDDTGAVFRRI